MIIINLNYDIGFINLSIIESDNICISKKWKLEFDSIFNNRIINKYFWIIRIKILNIF